MREPELRPRRSPLPQSPRVESRTHARKRSFLGGLLRLLLPRKATDAVALIVALAATGVVFVNALALQRPAQQPQPVAPAVPAIETPAPKANVPMPPKRTVAAAPAPLISPSPVTPANVPAPVPGAKPLVPPAPVPGAPMRTDNPAVKARVEMIVNVQRELSQRGYYEGAFDGLPGPRTEQAIKEFEQANGLRMTGEPTEQLLGQIKKARHRSEITGSIPTRPADSKETAQISSVQRTLARLGYGPIRVNGSHDPATRSAIERFERDRGMAVSGEISPKLQKELAAVTGAALD